MINSESELKAFNNFDQKIKQDDDFLRFLNIKIKEVDKELSFLDESKSKERINENKAFDNTSRILLNKSCPFSGKDAPKVDYKNINLLKKYTTEKGKILPSRVTQVSTKKQKELSQAVKRARFLALIPYVSN